MYVYIYMYLCEMIFAIFCLYFIHIGIGYECIVFSFIVKINLLTYTGNSCHCAPDSACNR